MTRTSISDFINAKRFAIVGVSRNNSKFGNALYRELKTRGKQVVPIHPTLDNFDGDPCFKNLSEALPKPDAVIINIGKDQVKSIIDDAHANQINQIWLQQGSETNEMIQYAKDLNMNVISGKCILMYMEPVSGIHSFHRFIWKLIKQY